MKIGVLHVMVILIFMSVIVSCNEKFNQDRDPDNSDCYVVFQKRSPKLPPKSLSRSVLVEEDFSTKSNAVLGNSDGLLGYSYSVKNSIWGDYENIGHQVVKIDKVKEYDEEYVNAVALNNYSAESFSYTDSQDYINRLEETEKISNDFRLDISIVEVGIETLLEDTFSSEITSQNDAIYGEVSMEYRNSSFELLPTLRKFYARECLAPAFMKSMYSSTIGDVLDAYGEFMLMGYITGGKAFALYGGKLNQQRDSTYRKSVMNTTIDASVSWKNNSVSDSCYFGNTSTHTISNLNEYAQLQTKLWLYGGQAAGLSMFGAADLEDVDINLNPWVQSLSDPSTHTIIDLTTDGLYPLSEFILEENFKRRYDDTALGYLSGNPTFITPRIDVMRVFERYSTTDGNALYDIAAVLITRQGDRIILRSRDASLVSDAELRSNENESVFMQKATEIAQEKQNYYDLEIRLVSSTRLNPIMGVPLCIDMGQIDEDAMCVYTNSNTGMQFIYDRTKRIAFSHLVDNLDGDWILDEYGIRDWVESLDLRSISPATIANSYKIVGL